MIEQIKKMLGYVYEHRKVIISAVLEIMVCVLMTVVLKVVV